MLVVGLRHEHLHLTGHVKGVVLGPHHVDHVVLVVHVVVVVVVVDLVDLREGRLHEVLLFVALANAEEHVQRFIQFTVAPQLLFHQFVVHH